MLQRRASYFSLHWQQIPSQHIFMSYTEDKWGLREMFSLQLLLSQIFWKHSQRGQPCRTITTLAGTKSLPQRRRLNFLPFSQLLLVGKKKSSQEHYQPAASTCASLTATMLHSLPRAENVLHQLQLLVASEVFVASSPSICAVIAPGIWAREDLSKLWGYSKRKLYFLISSPWYTQHEIHLPTPSTSPLLFF